MNNTYVLLIPVEGNDKENIEALYGRSFETFSELYDVLPENSSEYSMEDFCRLINDECVNLDYDYVCYVTVKESADTSDSDSKTTCVDYTRTIPVEELDDDGEPTGNVQHWTIKDVVEYINNDRLDGWISYNESDWLDGWKSWCQDGGWRIAFHNLNQDYFLTSN